MKRNLKQILVAVLLIAAFAATFIIISKRGSPKKAKPAQPPPLVETAEVVTGDIAHVLDLSGSVESYHVAQLASPAEGPIQDIRVREGDRVAKGNVLLSVGRKRGIDALIASLEEEFKKEENNLRRTRSLVESNVMPKEKLDQALASYEKVNAQLISAQETAKDYTLTAPWDGIVSNLLVKDGQYVAPRTPLLHMYEPNSLIIRAAIPEKYSTMISASLPVAIRFDAYDDRIVAGRIERVYPFLDSRLRTRTVEITLDKNEIELLPGMFARLAITLDTARDATVAPLQAVINTYKGKSIFIVEDGKAVQRFVATGYENGNSVQILDGVSPGEQAIVSGAEKVRDGLTIDVVQNTRDGGADK